MLQKGDLPQPNCAFPIHRMIWNGEERLHIFVIAMTLMILLLPEIKAYYQIKGCWLHFHHPKREQKDFVITSRDGDQNVKKGTKRGPGDLLVHTGCIYTLFFIRIT